MEYLAAIEKQAIDVIGTMRDFEDSEAESADPVKKSTDYVLLPNIEDIAKNGTKDEEDRPLTLQELQSSLKSHEAEGWVKKIREEATYADTPNNCNIIPTDEAKI